MNPVMKSTWCRGVEDVLSIYDLSALADAVWEVDA